MDEVSVVWVIVKHAQPQRKQGGRARVCQWSDRLSLTQGATAGQEEQTGALTPQSASVCVCVY